MTRELTSRRIAWTASLLQGLLSGTVSTLVITACGHRFEAAFVPVMIAHHRGAVQMADEAWNTAGGSAYPAPGRLDPPCPRETDRRDGGHLSEKRG